MNIFAWILLIAVEIPAVSAAGESTRPLTFEKCVMGEEAIERVHYAHQAGATKTFAQGISRELLEKKVMTYLESSIALEQSWNTPIMAEAPHDGLGAQVRSC